MRSSAGSRASSERRSRSTPERGEPRRDGLALVAHRKLAAGALEHVHARAGVAGPLR